MPDTVGGSPPPPPRPNLTDGSAWRLDGRVALVTGSTSGIGAGIARAFAAAGARVTLSGRSAEAGKRIVGEIVSAGGEAAFHRADLTQPDDCLSLVDATADRFGALDILVNNAASTKRGTVEDTPLADWDMVHALNLRAPYLLIQRAIPHLKAGLETCGRGGAVLNIGSVNAYIGESKLFAYSASKGGLSTLTKNAASYLLRYRIRVNQLNVGWTLTEGEERVKREEEGKGPEWVEEAAASRPFGRLLLPEDIAAAALYFCADASALVTGVIMDLEQQPVGRPPDL